MTANSSFSTQSSLDLHLSSMNTSLSLYIRCLISKPSSYIYRAFNITTIVLVLPICILILQHGLQEWRKKGSTFMEVTLSHSDCFTYNIVILDLFAVLGCIFCYCGITMNNLNLLFLPFIFYSFSCYGQVFFHMLTCVEHYIAAVHPITYRSRKEKGVRIRIISIGCVWLLCFAITGFIIIEDMLLAIVNICLLILFLTTSSFCSLSVLRVLIHPGPGEAARNRDRVDQTKKRAFYTIVIILGILVLKSFWDLNWSVVYITGGLNGCILLSWGSWVNLPSNLLFPLLFLYRKGKFVCCKNNMQKH